MAAPIALALLAALALAGSAQAEKQIAGNLVVGFDGGITPHALPRTEPAPIAVSVEGDFATTDGSDPPPQLRTIAIAINRDGSIYDRGLPSCRVRQIQPSTIRAARRICGAAIVGSGEVTVRVELKSQPPFTVQAPLLLFHARPAGGHRRLIGQLYGHKPPSSFILPFQISHKQGTFGTVIQTALPKPARRWAYVTHFQMKLHRTYDYEGEKRSYINAACAAPAGFPGAVYPFARAKFGFAGGSRVTSTLVRDCRVRG